MAKKDRTFAQKMGHQKVTAKKETCPQCKAEFSHIIYVAEAYTGNGHWSPRRRSVAVCNCNKKEIYG